MHRSQSRSPYRTRSRTRSNQSITRSRNRSRNQSIPEPNQSIPELNQSIPEPPNFPPSLYRAGIEPVSREAAERSDPEAYSAESLSGFLTTELLNYEFGDMSIEPPDCLTAPLNELEFNPEPNRPPNAPPDVEALKRSISSSQDGIPIMKPSIFRAISGIGVLTPEIDKLIKQASTLGVTLRFPKGTTSCRHLQLLYLVFPFMEHFPPEKHDRQLLSKIWRAAIKFSKELDNFYTWNKADATNPDVFDPSTFPMEDGVYPMGLVRNEGTHVCHYFLLLVERGRAYIYSAYGSDYVRMYPKKTPLDWGRFIAFIGAVNTYKPGHPTDRNDSGCRDGAAQGIVDQFIEDYFLSSGDGNTLTYVDEADDEEKKTTISEAEGIREELKTYSIPFQVIHFDQLKAQLKDAVDRAFTRGVFSGGKRTKRRTKRLRLKLRVHSFSTKLKR